MGRRHNLLFCKGFTILEALLLVTALAMLAGVLTPVLSSHERAERDRERAAALATLQQALEAWHADHGAYPSTNGAWWGDAPRFGAMEDSGPRAWIPGLTPLYLERLPRDPDESLPRGDRGFLYRSDGQDYKLLLHKTPESYSPASPWYDPVRPTWAWQISTPGALHW